MDLGQLSLRCDCTPVGDLWYDPERDTSPSAAVVEGLAAVSDVRPTALTPLYSSVDTDALDQLISASVERSGSDEQVVGFSVDDWNVFVRGDGRIRVCDPSGPAEPSPIFD